MTKIIDFHIWKTQRKENTPAENPDLLSNYCANVLAGSALLKFKHLKRFKRDTRDTILFCRNEPDQSDWWSFEDDAIVASTILQNHRKDFDHINDDGELIPTCRLPCDSIENCIVKLVKAGYRVATNASGYTIKIFHPGLAAFR